MCFDKSVYGPGMPGVGRCVRNEQCVLGEVCVLGYFGCDGGGLGVCVGTMGCGREGWDIKGPLVLREKEKGFGSGIGRRVFEA